MKRKVLRKVTVAPDLEVHVSVLVAAGATLVDLRQYVPSLKEYSRGVTVPKEAVSALVEAAQEVEAKW